MKKPDLKPGWVDTNVVYSWLVSVGVKEVKKLKRDNQTDGEIHHRYKHESGTEFDFNGNWYDALSWNPLVEWSEKQESRLKGG